MAYDKDRAYKKVEVIGVSAEGIDSPFITSITSYPLFPAVIAASLRCRAAAVRRTGGCTHD